MTERVSVSADTDWIIHQAQNKVPYTRRGAYNKKKQLWRRHRIKQYPYKCDVCGKWHLSSQNRNYDGGRL